MVRAVPLALKRRLQRSETRDGLNSVRRDRSLLNPLQGRNVEASKIVESCFVNDPMVEKVPHSKVWNANVTKEAG